MTDLYNKQTAKHYSAYRPPLHEIILDRVLRDDSSYVDGLDVGCGTGTSTVAIATYCSNVIGIDPSQSMLDRASKHPKIKYLTGSGEKIPLADDSIDVVTFAGSLFYMDVNEVARELKRVCRKDTVIISYDFEVLLHDILGRLDIKKKETNSEYDYQINFSGIDSFKKIISKQEQINLHLSPSELAHVLLSDHYQYNAFSEKYSSDHLFEKLKNEMDTSGEPILVQTTVFYSRYQLVPK